VEYLKRLAKRSVFLLMIGVSLVVGRMVPAIYDWTGTDQSWMSPLVPQAAVALLLCGLITCLALPWLRMEHDPPTTGGAVQFSLRTILAGMAVIGGFLAVFRDTPLYAISGSVQAIIGATWCGSGFSIVPSGGRSCLTGQRAAPVNSGCRHAGHPAGRLLRLGRCGPIEWPMASCMAAVLCNRPRWRVHWQRRAQ
jgi:hypothetical protein